MLLLTDRTMDIPPFLLRNQDGSFAHPTCAVPEFTATVKVVKADPIEVAIAAALAKDEAVRQRLRQAETMSAKERHVEQAVARKAQKDAEAARLLQNKLKQREVFIQHFKWDHEQ
jgi:hypothetical protein